MPPSAAIEMAQQAQREKREAGETIKSQNPIQRHHSKTKPTLGSAVRGYCYWCMGGEISDNSTMTSLPRLIRDCPDTNCGLFTVRPYRDKAQKQKELKWAKDHTKERGFTDPKTKQTERDDVMDKAYRNPESWRSAVNAKCYDCSGRSHDPGARGRVKACTDSDCSLHFSRPWQKIKGPTAEHGD